jgi:hypothetical protein
LIDTNSDNDISYKHYEYRRAKQKKKEW